jgi:hypothetical protein
LRPLTLEAVEGRITEFCFKYQAVRLVETHFPEGERVKPKDDWDDALFHFLRMVSAKDWFEVDWEVLDELYNCWLNDPEGCYNEDLAAYLTGIPVKCYGFSENDFENYTGLRVLAAMVNEAHSDQVSADLLEDLDIYRIGAVTIEETLERVANTDFSAQPAPLCWLAEMVGIAAANTGNVLLDTTFEWGEWWPEFFTWADDLERVKAAWLEAKPVAEHLEAFKEWLGEEEEVDGEKIRQMVDVLLGEQEGEDEDGE